MTVFVLAAIVSVGIRAGWWEAPEGEKAPGWEWLERISWMAGIAGGVISWQSLRLSRRTAIGVPGGEESTLAPSPQPAGDGATPQPAGRYPDLLDRGKESEELRSKLLDGSWGVIVVRGRQGVGKSKLVRAVVDGLQKEAQGEDRPRICWHDAVPGRRVDVKTLIDVLEGDGTGPAAGIKPGELSLTRFRAALEALGTTPVVIVIDCAEHLIDRNSKHLVDFDLDEAFEILATTRGHRVTVVLVTQLSPDSRESTWPQVAYTITVSGLPPEEFAAFFGELDRNRELGLDRDPGVLDTFYAKLQGNLRLAELAYAVLTDRGMIARDLADELSGIQNKDVPQALTYRVIESLNPLQRRVLEVLAAFATPVRVDAVAELLAGEWPQKEVAGALQVLLNRRVVRIADGDRYYLTPSDAGWLPEDSEQWRNLLLAAADALWRRKEGHPRGIDDLHLHFAALDALLRAGLYESAYEWIQHIDGVLRDWNCAFMLLDQRETIRGRMEDSHWEMANETVLGDLYASRGRFREAAEAYRRALDYSEARNDPTSRTKIRFNLATMYWQQNRIKEACEEYAVALAEAKQAGNLQLQMGPLEGLADCHRRWGEYDRAVEYARQALALPRLPEYPSGQRAQADAATRTVKIALKLARWHAELGKMSDAERLLDVAKEELPAREGDRLRAAYLDAYADWLLDEDDIAGAIRQACRAEEQALRVHDPVVLLQSRTTLCLAHLRREMYGEAARAIEGAARFRQEGRSLLVLALHALVARHQSNPGKAAELFRQLRKEATERIERDGRDFAAWEFKGFAICGIHLDDGQADLSAAIRAFEKAGRPLVAAPGLTQRMITLLRRLDRTGRRPNRLRPVIEAVSGMLHHPGGA
ncbi:AAA family ATPase [Thermoactinospora rubra]|uniref:tetratricopeptide repeat protein n=1 Tax=Thermoactinospora rubra TaxID=1088767 RepID=UPI000A11EB10|nr:AAA family ATPase [Thermoactinospora rubra]